METKMVCTGISPAVELDLYDAGYLTMIHVSAESCLKASKNCYVFG